MQEMNYFYKKGIFVNKITLKDIARYSGFSEATVSRALSGSSKISLNTKKKIIQAADKSGYLTESHNLAIIVPWLDFSRYLGILLTSLCLELQAYGFKPVIVSVDNLELLEEIPICGAISAMTCSGLERYWGEKHTWPLVCINTKPFHLEGIFSVSSNEEQGMESLVKLLAEQGHRKILRVGGEYSFYLQSNWCATQRNQAFEKLMEKYGIESDLIVAAENDIVALLDSLKRALAKKPTALIIQTEYYMIPVMKALDYLNVEIPRDLSVVGWDVADQIKNIYPVPTHIQQNFEVISKKACEMFRRLRDGNVVTEDVFVNYLFYRGSTVADAQKLEHNIQGK